MTAIRRFARQIAERFHPEKIILFGSYAHGTPHNESDVNEVMDWFTVISRRLT